MLAGQAPRFLPRARGPALPGTLAPEQEAALDLADRSLDVALVHGPPGTGKTTVLVEVIRRAVARGEKVLAAAPSNLAADNLLERLVAAGVDGVRVGHPARVVPGLLDRTLEARVKGHESARIAEGLVEEALVLRRDARKRREKRGPGRFSQARDAERRSRELLAEARRLEDRAERDVLDRAQVVVATLTGVDAPVLSGRRFALAAVDEATQAVEPAVILALLRADRAVLAGDHLQLPPTVISAAAAEGGFGVSLFERLASIHGESIMVTLAEQRRMNEAIMRFPSQAMYGGRLRAHPSVAGWKLDDEPLLFVDTAGTGYEEGTPEGSESRHNEGEAALTAREVERVLALGVAPGDVAVISPYDAQVQRLRQVLVDAGGGGSRGRHGGRLPGAREGGGGGLARPLQRPGRGGVPLRRAAHERGHHQGPEEARRGGRLGNGGAAPVLRGIRAARAGDGRVGVGVGARVEVAGRLRPDQRLPPAGGSRRSEQHVLGRMGRQLHGVEVRLGLIGPAPRRALRAARRGAPPAGWRSPGAEGDSDVLASRGRTRRPPRVPYWKAGHATSADAAGAPR